MKISVNFKAMALGSTSTLSKDGKNTYYKLSFEDLVSGEAGTLSCTEDVAKNVKRFTEYQCIADYNTDYNSFRVVSLVPLPTSK